MTQFSLFGAAAAAPVLGDLDGILLAGGHWVRRAGTARVSVVVDARWRAEALAAEFALRRLQTDDAIVEAVDGFGVRTAFAAELVAGSARWSRGANEGPPPGFLLSPGGLRLWALASGRREPSGYLLRTAHADVAAHLSCGAQLSRLGLAGVSISSRGGSGWRITSTKRVRRLGELLGAAPPGGAEHWPTERLLDPDGS